MTARNQTTAWIFMILGTLNGIYESAAINPTFSAFLVDSLIRGSTYGFIGWVAGGIIGFFLDTTGLLVLYLTFISIPSWLAVQNCQNLTRV